MHGIGGGANSNKTQRTHILLTVLYTKKQFWHTHKKTVNLMDNEQPPVIVKQTNYIIMNVLFTFCAVNGTALEK